MIGEIVRAIIIMSVTGSLIACLLFALKPLWRNRLPKWAQYYLWLVALAALIIPVSRLAVVPDAPVSPPLAPVHSAIDNTFVTIGEDAARANLADTGTPTGEQAAVEPRSAQDPLLLATTAFIWIYPLAVAVVLVHSIIGYGLFTLKVRRSRTRAGMEELYEHVGLCGDDRPPRLYRSSIITTPMLIGIIKPELILPDRAYSSIELQNVLRHELTHLRRRDVAVKWLVVVACALHWFNPIVWLMRREIDRACELSCDEAVVRDFDPVSKQAYGNTLIRVAADSVAPKAVLSPAMSENKKNLKERLTAIMKHKNPIAVVSIISVTVIVLAVIGTGALAVGQKTDGTVAAPPATSTQGATEGPEGAGGPSVIDLDPDQIDAYFEMTRAEIIELLGDYEVRDSRTGGGFEVLYFPAVLLGFEFFIQEGVEADPFSITCGEDAPCGINGTDTTMDFAQIMDQLGGAEIVNWTDESGRAGYTIWYEIGNSDYAFSSSDPTGSRDGTLSIVQIGDSPRRFADPVDGQGSDGGTSSSAVFEGEMDVSGITYDATRDVYIISGVEALDPVETLSGASDYTLGAYVTVEVLPGDTVRDLSGNPVTMDQLFHDDYQGYYDSAFNTYQIIFSTADRSFGINE